MFAQFIIIILLIIGFLFLVWKVVIEPRVKDEKKEPEHIVILEAKLEKLYEMQEEYESIKEEREVTGQMKVLDEEIDNILEEIKKIENA